jgi:subtilase family serine protease
VKLVGLRRPSRGAVVGATLAAGALVGSALAGATPATAAPTPVAHRITVAPQVEPAGTPHAASFTCQTRPLDGSQGPRCYQPAQIQNAYAITPLLDAGKNGAGRTIVIVDAYGSPTIAGDLSFFDSTFDLPHASFTQIAPAGAPPAFDGTDANQVGWAFETTLDVEWAHAVAPGANIVLAVAKSNEDADILATTRYVIEHNPGDVISQSFGEAEKCMDPQLLDQQHALFAQAVRKGITLVASSGDSGAAQPACAGDGALLSASTPASDPNVTGVGGTTLDADPATGAYHGETAWTEPFGCNPPAVATTDVNCSGGGFSSLYSRPAYQAGFVKGASARGVPDVAYDAGVAGGVLVGCSFCNVLLGGAPSDPPIFLISGGTSAGAPQWAGLVAIGDQLGHHRMGNINPALYAAARVKPVYRGVLHDITVGNNDVAEIGAGYDTTTGWDPVTGLGSPKAVTLLPALATLTH